MTTLTLRMEPDDFAVDGFRDQVLAHDDGRCSLPLGDGISLYVPVAEFRAWLAHTAEQFDTLDRMASTEQNRAGVAAAKATLPHAESQQVAS